MAKHKFKEKLKLAYQTFKHADRMIFPGILIATETEYEGIRPSELESLGIKTTLVLINKEGQEERVRWKPYSVFGR